MSRLVSSICNLHQKYGVGTAIMYIIVAIMWIIAGILQLLQH